MLSALMNPSKLLLELSGNLRLILLIFVSNLSNGWTPVLICNTSLSSG